MKPRDLRLSFRQAPSQRDLDLNLTQAIKHALRHYRSYEAVSLEITANPRTFELEVTHG